VDIKAYISSGVIEAWVLGMATAEEAAELEMMRRQYPEVNQAVLDFEEHLEKVAMSNAEAAPVHVKRNLNDVLAGEFRSTQNGNGRLVEMSASSTNLVRPVWKYVAAACLVLLVGSSILNFYLYNQYQSTDRKYSDLLAQQTTLQARVDVMNTKLAGMDESMKIMTDPTVLHVAMPSAKQGENFIATVFWDTKTKDVYLLNNNLPQAPKGKQYQLWALVDGIPVDAGMMDVCAGVCHMKNIPKAQAFAITLEKQGGSPTPDLSQLYVLGKI
jgi:anti-sigma-K factor RskA